MIQDESFSTNNATISHDQITLNGTIVNKVNKPFTVYPSLIITQANSTDTINDVTEYFEIHSTLGKNHTISPNSQENFIMTLTPLEAGKFHVHSYFPTIDRQPPLLFGAGQSVTVNMPKHYYMGIPVETVTIPIIPPLKQLEQGIALDKIYCKQNLILIQKYDGTPACVTESTKQKLVERGWTKSSTWTASYEIPTVIIPLGSGSVDTQKNFEPQTIKVVLGVNNTVRWINQDDVPSSINSDHDYDGYGFTSPHLKPGDAWTHTFTKAGVYDYHSIPHPWKNGKVIVEEETENIVNGITWGSNITKNYGINDNIEFQVTVTMKILHAIEK